MADKAAAAGQDSDAEEEQQAYAKSRFSLTIDFDESKVPAGAMVVLCARGCPQALMRILFDDALTEIGTVKASEESFKEPADVATIYANQNLVIIFQAAGMKSQYLG